MESTRSKPVTCKLTPRELQERKTTVIEKLKTLVLERKELEDGFSYKFFVKDEILDHLINFIKVERLCCDFFSFQITIEADNALLKITGSHRAKEFLMKEVDL